MANIVPTFEGGWTLTADGDVAVSGPPTRSRKIAVHSVIIVKAVADGTVTFKDGNGVVCLITDTLVNGTMTQIPISIKSLGFELDTSSAGTSVVTVLGEEVGG